MQAGVITQWNEWTLDLLNCAVVVGTRTVCNMRNLYLGGVLATGIAGVVVGLVAAVVNIVFFPADWTSYIVLVLFILTGCSTCYLQEKKERVVLTGTLSCLSIVMVFLFGTVQVAVGNNLHWKYEYLPEDVLISERHQKVAAGILSWVSAAILIASVVCLFVWAQLDTKMPARWQQLLQHGETKPVYGVYATEEVPYGQQRTPKFNFRSMGP